MRDEDKRAMVANEDLHTYHRKIVDTELQIAQRLLQIPHEDEVDKREILQREVENFRAMIPVYQAAKIFLEQVLFTGNEAATSTSGPPRVQA